MSGFLKRLLGATAVTALVSLAGAGVAGAEVGPGSEVVLMPPYLDVSSDNTCTGACFAQTGTGMGDLRVGALGPGSSARATMTLRHDLDKAARAIAYTVTFQPQLGQYMAGDVLLEVSAVDDACDCSARTSVPLPPPPLPPAPGQQPGPPPPVTVTFTLFGTLAPGVIRVTSALVIPPLHSEPPGAMATGQVTSIRGEVS